MPSLETLLLFTAAALVMNISPGPSNFYVMSRSLAQGPTAGLVAASGLAMGSLAHVTAAALGLSAIFIYSPMAFSVLKLAGAGYLVYLGLRCLSTPPGPPTRPDVDSAKGWRRVFAESALVEVLNPKTALFFLAFLPQFADVDAGPLAPQILLLGLIVTLTGLPCDALVAVMSGKAARLMTTSAIVRGLQRWAPGSVLIGLGAFLALDGRSPD